MNKKNIKIITFGNFPYGGASANFIRYLALALASSNSIEVVLPSGYYFGDIKNKKRKGKIENVKYKYLGFRNHPKNYFGKVIDNFLSYFLLLIFLIKVSFNKPQTIILYNVFFTSAIIVLLTKIFSNNKYIVILPEFYEKPNTILARIKWYNFYFGINHLAKYFDGAIVLSYYLEKFVKSNTKNNIKKLIIPNLLDPDNFNINNVKLFKKNKITIGYCGTPTRKDGATDLIKSFSILNHKYKNTHLLIIGDITNGKTILPELKKLASDLKIVESITFTGLVPFSKIPELLNSCQILALTRPNGVFAEAGFPTKLGEYFACRKPVVITKVGDIIKYFKNEKEVILVDPENIQDIAKGFEKLILSEDLRNRIGLSGFQWMNKNLNYRKMSMVIDKYIDSLYMVS